MPLQGESQGADPTGNFLRICIKCNLEMSKEKNMKALIHKHP